MQGKYLINTGNWFTAPDGKDYKAVYGDVKIVSDEVLNVKTNRMSANWYAVVKGKTEEMIIAGCQIYYAVKASKKPNDKTVDRWDTDAVNGVKISKQPSKIYILK